jgi:hypothetical protein
MAIDRFLAVISLLIAQKYLQPHANKNAKAPQVGTPG